jgi:hypothetical protein
MRASAVVKRQSALVWFLFRLLCQAATSLLSVSFTPVQALRSQNAQLGFRHVQAGVLVIFP